MYQVTNYVTLTDKDLLTFNKKQVRIGQYSLVNEAITFLLKQLADICKDQPLEKPLVMPKIVELIDSEIALAKFSLEISKDDNYENGIDIAKAKIKLLEKLKNQFNNFSA